MSTFCSYLFTRRGRKQQQAGVAAGLQPKQQPKQKQALAVAGLQPKQQPKQDSSSTSCSSAAAKARLLRQMDGTIRCVVSLGRPSGCGMPGSVAAAPLALLMDAATREMQQCIKQLSDGKSSSSSDSWCFIDIGAGAGRMLLVAQLFGASCCAGIELCDLSHTFAACMARLVKKGLLPAASTHACTLHVGDAMQYADATSLLTPVAATALGAVASGAAAVGGPVMVSLIDEGMPLAVREHVYSRIAQDPRVQVVVTVNYRSRAGHLPSLLAKGGLQLEQEMPAPLMGGRCATAGRIYVRRQQPLLLQPQLQVQQPQEQQQQQPPQRQQRRCRSVYCRR